MQNFVLEITSLLSNTFSFTKKNSENTKRKKIKMIPNSLIQINLIIVNFLE